MYEKELEVAFNCENIAKKIIIDNYNKTFKINKKIDDSFVTEIDIKVQEAIIKIIKKEFPNDKIIAEEKKNEKVTKRCWFIDSIDGTIDFIKRNGEFSICINLN